MLTNQTQEYKFEFDDKARVVEFFTESLANPNFRSFHIFMSQEWPLGTFTSTPKKVYTVNVGVTFK